MSKSLPPPPGVDLPPGVVLTYRTEGRNGLADYHVESVPDGPVSAWDWVAAFPNARIVDWYGDGSTQRHVEARVAGVVLTAYQKRSPLTVPKAEAFDRIVALFAEPGGARLEDIVTVIESTGRSVRRPVEAWR